jgi:hypothetical protein
MLIVISDLHLNLQVDKRDVSRFESWSGTLGE